MRKLEDTCLGGNGIKIFSEWHFAPTHNLPRNNYSKQLACYQLKCQIWTPPPYGP